MRLPSTFLAGISVIACSSSAGERVSAADEGARLAALLACHDEAVGGAALRAMQRVEYDLEIQEPGFAVEGRYFADRDGTMRIDIFAGGERVFSEWWDGEAGWQLPQGAAEPVPTSPEGGEALRHGVETAGHLSTLADMSALGHRVALVDPEPADPGVELAIETTLADGTQGWSWLDLETCLLTRTRDFRAFHPDVDPEARWIETRFEDFRTDEGITRAWTTLNIDLVTGDTIGTTRIRAVRYVPIAGRIDGASRR